MVVGFADSPSYSRDKVLLSLERIPRGLLILSSTTVAVDAAHGSCVPAHAAPANFDRGASATVLQDGLHPGMHRPW